MVAAVSLALVVSAVAAGCGSKAAAPPTAQVERGQVSTKVSASGALSPVTQAGMAFPKAAQLTQLLVKVGDTVRAGQVLAREDNFAFDQALNQERGTLNQEQAVLNRLVRTPLVSGDRRSVDQAKKIESATQANARAIHEKDENAVTRARQAVDLAQRQLEQARDAYRYCLETYTPTARRRRSPSGGTSGNPLSSLTGSTTSSVAPSSTPTPTSTTATSTTSASGTDPCASQSLGQTDRRYKSADREDHPGYQP